MTDPSDVRLITHSCDTILEEESADLRLINDKSQPDGTISHSGSSKFSSSNFYSDRGIAKSTSSSFKRVSFGSSKGSMVETHLYEPVPTEEIEEPLERRPSTSGSDCSRQPSKVRVTFVESQTPTHIPPPAQVVKTVETSAIISGSDPSQLTLVLSTSAGLVPQSSPLPKLQSMSQSETEENPFNPGGELSVEVEPIVEAYKHRPYPTSPVGSPVRHTGGPADHPDCFVDQVEILGAGERLQNGHKVDSRPKDIKLIDGTGSNANADGTDVVKAGTLRSPKAGKPQIVHIDEKKKKCCCCAVQ